jgi:hypothetical protein
LTNRRMRTRMSGGVGGGWPRGSPLSRFKNLKMDEEKFYPEWAILF